MEMLLTPSMLVLTREAKGWTQRDLARRSGISQGVISKIESGFVDVTGDRLLHIADILDCPPKLLCRPAVRVDTANACLHHRRRQSKLSASATKRIEGIAHLTRVTVEGVFDGIQVELATDVDPTAVFDYAESLSLAPALTNETPHGETEFEDGMGSDPDEDPALRSDTTSFDPARADAAADYLRRHWDLTGPIENLIGTLEAKGILVIYRSLGSRAQDGVSSWPADPAHPPIIVVNKDLPADRVRFTVTHELAHLLLHRMPSDHAEREANRFAAEFLVPAVDIAPELAGLTTRDLPRLARLKDKWGVSIGMLVQRARDLGIISDRQFREFRVRLARLGWDVYEPSNLTVESPTMLDKAFRIGKDELNLTTDELAEMAYMTPSSFRRHYLPSPGEDRAPRQVLNVAGSALDAPPRNAMTSGAF